jgi:uncharacterized protein
MATWRRWAAGAAVGAAGAAVAAASGVAAIAQRFVEELSRPGVPLEEAAPGAGWELPRTVAEPPVERQRPLSFGAPGGPALRGEFWAQPEPAPTIVICHGYRVDRTRLRPVAALEYQHGYNILLFDFRGHGESAQVATSGGNAEVRDLTAALDVAARQPETLPGRLFVHGFSMGAAVALLAAPRADVAGIIADSPYARLGEILCRLMTWQLTIESDAWAPPIRWLRAGFPALARATLPASDLIFRVRHHHALLARPDVRIRSWGKRSSSRERRRVPILLIHALGDPFIPVEHTLRIALAARAGRIPFEMHLADSAIHCGAYGYDPDRYIAVLKQFIARACEDDTVPAPEIADAALRPPDAGEWSGGLAPAL